jgi:hypothetical protein
MFGLKQDLLPEYLIYLVKLKELKNKNIWRGMLHVKRIQTFQRLVPRGKRKIITIFQTKPFCQETAYIFSRAGS